MKTTLHSLVLPTVLVACLGAACLGVASVANAGETEVIQEVAPPPQEEFTLFPVPDYTGDVWTRDVLLGDLGFRTNWAERGIQLELHSTQIYQGVIDGGRPRADSDWEYSGSVDYVLNLDTGKAGLWPGGFLTVHGETFYGNGVNGSTGSLLPVNTDFVLSAPYGEGTYLPHVVMTQFLSEKFAISFGKLDTTVGDANDFAHGTGDERFMNLAYSFNPVSVLVSPYAALGGGMVFLPNDKITMGITAFDTNGNIRDSGFDTLFNGNTTYAGDIAVKTSFFDRPGTQRVAVLGSTGDFTTLGQDPRVLVPALGVTPDTASGTWAVAYNFDQYLTESWGLFGRVGVADGDANIFETFFSVGVGGNGLIPGRENDRFGLGLYYAGISDSVNAPLLDNKDRGLEVFYQFAVTPWFALSADVQVIDPALKTADTATVLGLTGKIRF